VSHEESFDFEMPNFIPIFTGLEDNIANGEFTPASLGVYVVLHLKCGYDNGIFMGSSTNLCNYMGGADKAVVNAALAHLKRHKKINYPRGNGSRKGYRILLNKYLVRKGALKGWTLNAFADNSLTHPLYERPNGGPTEEGWSRDGGVTVFQRNDDGTPTESLRIQEYKNINRLTVEEFPNRKKRYKTRLVSNDQPSGVPQERVLPADAHPIPDSEKEPSKSDDQAKPMDPEKQAKRLAARYILLLGNQPAHRVLYKAWTQRFLVLLSAFSLDNLEGAMKWACEDSVFWADKMDRDDQDPVEYFAERAQKIVKQYLGWKRTQGAQDKEKERQVAAAPVAAVPESETILYATPISELLPPGWKSQYDDEE
jgi:hypothetical protein